MIKLTLGKAVEVRDAKCDWCGVERECAKAPDPIEVENWVYDYELKWLRSGSWFSQESLYPVRTGPSRLQVDRRNVDICKDCASQIGKMLAN